MTSSLPLPAGLPLDIASWEQTTLVVRQVVIDLLAVIEQQAKRIAALEARVSQHSRNSDRPPSSDPPYAKRTAHSGMQGRPGAKPGHPGHRQALLVPTEIIAVKPETCGCGQREFPDSAPYDTHQVIELPEIAMQVTHVVLHEARCPQCGHLIKALLPEEHRYGYGPRLTALIGELSGPQRDSRSAVREFCTSVFGPIKQRDENRYRIFFQVFARLRPHFCSQLWRLPSVVP